MNWKIKTFDELTTNELYAILRERVDIFVVEQQCAYRELDNFDQSSYHIYACDGKEIAAYARILPSGTAYPELSIGRVLVKESYRGRGLAVELMKRALDFIREELKEKVVRLQAQEYLLSFYGSLGFEKISEVYLDEGIPHADMLLKFK
ncbi:GNAT family N-acetyltransferase [Siminovitchia fortis]|uniref:GNAT family N-acetyltransferase n=1 Tax=Siminovitchia fortis TaxID=254758 RepID=A0A443IYF2_9BACI|nr:GNAT family N-acetyltransferase [Siminovitchia fortis]RWR13134.1 GNAT family N-acetyltransferase [Siminovitchia fortis]WHY82083.1 GNAT family N-acetyltransferase [Siminovitchia fortis]